MDFFFFVFLGASALAGHPSPRDDVAAAPAPAMPHTFVPQKECVCVDLLSAEPP